MSIVSMNVLYAPSIRDTLRKVDPEHATVRSMDPIYTAISSIIGPYGTVSQVDIHSKRNFMVGWGNYELFKKGEYGQLPAYQEIQDKDGAKYLSTPVLRGDLAYYNRYLRDKKFISLYRLFFDGSFQEEGIVEVIQNCEVFFSYLDGICEENPDRAVYIFNERGEQVYPYLEVNGEIPESVQSACGPGAGKEQTLYTAEKQFVFWKNMKENDWKIVVTQDQKQMLWPIFLMIAVCTFIGVLFLGISMILCYRISHIVTKPLNQLKHNIELLDLNNILKEEAHFEAVEARTAEVGMLSQVFLDMYEKLGSSTQSLLCAREEEMRAKMIATQSMITPHFVFNNLANISVMAEEHMDEEITRLCKNLCDYLRYIAADSLKPVDVKTEIFYTKKYLDCIRVRYGKRLECFFDIPKELEEVPLSKLTLQPLVENAQKYAFRTKPPWVIAVTGAVYADGWELSVSDNGIGIKKEYQKEIRENIERIRKTRDISAMQIGGMGLANVYLRLLLLHGDDAELLISNREEGGARVTIRGKWKNGEEETEQ